MCLIIHKPANQQLPEGLLESAATYNPHGFGVMTFGDNNRPVVRRSGRTNFRELQKICDTLGNQECVIHLRYATSGQQDLENAHPFRVTKDIYVAHNGTLNLQRHTPERSDTWHLINDYLKPVLGKNPALLHDRFFQHMVEAWCGPNNRFVFLDNQQKKTVIINRQQGFEVNGIWLSNTRWFERQRFDWVPRALSTGPAAPARFAF
ncbi:MAG TPA: class II glutamine amidotransferase [Pseudohongiella sp.]|nr:class II glutamine amidotransferase [Pseudohongiella sp.]